MAGPGGLAASRSCRGRAGAGATRWCREFLRRLGAPAPVGFEIFDDAVLRRANELSFGALPVADVRPGARALPGRLRRRLPRHLELAAGAQRGLRRACGRGRPASGRSSSRSSRGCRRPAPAPTSGWRCGRAPKASLALGLAHVIMQATGSGPASAAGRAGRARRRAGRPACRRSRPAAVEQRDRRGGRARRAAGARVRRRTARRWPSSAAPPLAHTNGLAQALAVNALNALVGSVDVAGRRVVHAAGGAPAAPARTLPRRCSLRPPPQLLLLDEANPVFAAPAAWKVARVAAPGPLHRQLRLVHRRHQRASPTSILPDHSFLESWVDSVPESGAARGCRHRGRTGDEAALRHPLDARRAARRRRAA